MYWSENVTTKTTKLKLLLKAQNIKYKSNLNNYSLRKCIKNQKSKSNLN